MGLSILDFKSKLIGGGSRPNLFEVEIPFPSNIGQLGETLKDSNNTSLTNSAKFLVKAAQIPASDIGVIPISFRGRELKMAGDRTFEPWTVTVINDSEYRLRSAFESWSRGINALTENVSQLGFTTETNNNGCTPYLVDLKVTQLSRECVTPTKTPTNPTAVGVANEKRIRSYKFYGAWVSSIGAMDLSYDANDQIHEYPVTFQYQFYEVLNTP